MKPFINAEYMQRHTACYGLASKVIQSLELVRHKYASYFDEEASMYLDVTMIDVSREGKENLKKFHCCLLCQTSNCDLQHSHVIPRAILEFFTQSMGQTFGKKSIKTINVPKRKRFQYLSSNELAFYTFCRECEKIFNDQGEKEFLKFFKKIYDPSDTYCLEKEHSLAYGPWLYHFCISLLFRAIATSTGIPDHMESTQVYNFFVQCRKFLLDQSSLDSQDLPEVFLMFNPTTVPQEYQLKVMNQILVAPGFFFCDSVSLLDGTNVEPPVAHFIVAHIGVLNMIAVFNRKDAEMAGLGTYKISPTGGLLKVPHESERVLPKGLWAVFCSQSADFRREMQKSFFHKQDKPPVPIQTASTEAQIGKQEAFKIVAARSKDSQIFADQCEQESLAELNLLPETFIIKQESAVVYLPSDHQILLHYTTFEQDGSGTMALIGIVSKKQQPIRPFIIHYQFSSTNIFCVGFFLSRAGTVEGIMCDTPLDEYPTVRYLVQKVKDSIPTSLPVILNAKGYINLESLLYHFEHR